MQIQSRSQHSISQHSLSQHSADSSESIEAGSLCFIRSLTLECCASTAVSQGVAILSAIVCPIKATQITATMIPFETALNIYTSTIIRWRSLGVYAAHVNIYKGVFYILGIEHFIT